MAVTTVQSIEHKEHYIFRFEEEVEGNNGHKFIRGVPFHITLTMPTGALVVSKYGYKESTHIEIDVKDIKELRLMLDAAQEKYNDLRRLREQV